MAEQAYVHMPTLEEYSKRFKHFFKFKRSDDGILEVRMHTFDGPVRWSYQMHHAISELWTQVGHDTNNEVLIFTATGDQWINDVDASSFKDIEENPDNIPRFNVQIYDTLKVVENFVNDIEIPTICAITGQGIHWEMAMMSDITLCTPDFHPAGRSLRACRRARARRRHDPGPAERAGHQARQLHEPHEQGPRRRDLPQAGRGQRGGGARQDRGARLGDRSPSS